MTLINIEMTEIDIINYIFDMDTCKRKINEKLLIIIGNSFSLNVNNIV